jgi:hypothetical protein
MDTTGWILIVLVVVAIAGFGWYRSKWRQSHPRAKGPGPLPPAPPGVTR